jgi:hypothetical protein
MRLLSPEHVKLYPLPDDDDLRSMIRIGPLQGMVHGVVLEAAIEIDRVDASRMYLLFLSNDVPYEDSLAINLLDADLTTIDRAGLGGMYATGWFRDMELHDPATVTFSFFDEKEWCVAVLDTPERRVPFIGDATGVYRPFGFKRHFTVSAS